MVMTVANVTLLKLFSNFEIGSDNKININVRKNQINMFLSVSVIEIVISRSESDLDIVMTLVSIIIERTSSIIEVDIIVTPSDVLIFFLAESMLAAIPAEEGVAIIPIKRAVGLMNCTSNRMVDISAKLVKVPMTSVIPINPPRGKNLRNNFKSVSSPAIKSRIMEAIVDIANISSLIR